MKKLNYIGLDVHKKNITIGESKEKGKAEIIGDYPNTESGIKKIIRKLNIMSEEYEIKICYEAGPCGYALKRILDKYDFSCEIVAPSLIPVRSGDRIKTDKKDAKKLARLYRAGELTFITVPDEEKEAIRDFVRCRDDIMTDFKRTKQRLNHFLIRHGYNYDRTNWTKTHIEWIKKVKFEHNILQQTIGNYINQMEYLNILLNDIDKEIEQIALTEEYKDKVEALCAFRGIKVLTAMIIISEVIDFSRFSNPKELMSYLGIVPSEYSSGGSIKKGSITKCGNKKVRRVLTLSAKHYQKKPVITKSMKESLEKIKPELRIAPTKAIKRLYKRHWHLSLNGKIAPVINVAIARELVGFIWHSMILIEDKIPGINLSNVNKKEIA